MDIKEIYLIETVKSLHQEIKMFEKERQDIMDINRLKPLYDLYYSNIEKLEFYK